MGLVGWRRSQVGEDDEQGYMRSYTAQRSYTSYEARDTREQTERRGVTYVEHRVIHPFRPMRILEDVQRVAPVSRAAPGFTDGVVVVGPHLVVGELVSRFGGEKGYQGKSDGV